MNNLEIILDKDTIVLKGNATKYTNISNKNLRLYEVINILELFDKTKLGFLQKEIIIDLDGVTKIDTVGLAVFMQWMRELNKINLELKFININEKINYACRLYGVSNVFA